MTFEPRLVSLAIAMLIIHLFVTYALYRTARRAGGRLGQLDVETVTIDRQDGTVVCPECGVRNELGYRYCRECVGELPVAMTFDADRDSPIGRFAR